MLYATSVYSESMREKSLDKILGDFKPSEASKQSGTSERRAVTIWLKPDEKARYDRLQQLSKSGDRRFSDITRETMLALIELAESRAS